jgi:hypothetical protein
MKFSLIIILLVIIFQLNCFEQDTSVCKLKKNSVKCPKKFSLKCGKRFCSINQMNCNNFLASNIFLIHMSKLNKIFERDLENFYSNNKYCPKNWSNKDVCLIKKKCIYKPKIWLLADVPKIWIKCECEKSYSYKCGKDYCSKDKEACDGLDLKKFKGKIHGCK